MARMKDNNRGFINVKEYGATGDGTTDDTPAIQKALDQACDEWGSTVFFPSGNYLINRNLVVQALRQPDWPNFGEPSDIHFAQHVECLITGSGTATIVAGAQMESMLSLCANPNLDTIGPFYSQVYNLRFNGKYCAKTCIAISDTMHATVSKNTIIDCEYGIRNSGNYGVGRFKDNIIIAEKCIDFYKSGGDGAIQSNIFNMVKRRGDGIGIGLRKYSGNLVIENNTFEGGPTRCIGVRFNTESPIVDEVRDVRISNNTFRGISCGVYTTGGKPVNNPIVFNILVNSNIMQPSLIQKETTFSGQLISFNKVTNSIIIDNCISSELTKTNTEVPCIQLIDSHGPLVANNCFSNLYGPVIYMESTDNGIVSRNSIRNGGMSREDNKIIELSHGSNYNQVKNNTMLQSDSKYAKNGIVNADDNIGNIIDDNIFLLLEK